MPGCSQSRRGSPWGCCQGQPSWMVQLLLASPPAQSIPSQAARTAHPSTSSRGIFSLEKCHKIIEQHLLDLGPVSQFTLQSSLGHPALLGEALGPAGTAAQTPSPLWGPQGHLSPPPTPRCHLPLGAAPNIPTTCDLPGHREGHLALSLWWLHLNPEPVCPAKEQGHVWALVPVGSSPSTKTPLQLLIPSMFIATR